MSTQSCFRRRSWAGLSVLLFLLVGVHVVQAQSAPQTSIPQGGSASFSPVSSTGYPGVTWTWEIVPPGGGQASTNAAPNGWTVSYSGQFTVGVPAGAAVGSGYWICYNTGGGSGPLASFSVTAAASPPAVPVAPTGLTAIAGNQSVSLAWTATSGAASYSVLRGTSAGAESTTALMTGLTSPSYTDSTASNGTTYFYVVKAVNGSGTSPASNEVSATPVPALLSVAVSPANVTGGSTVAPVTGTVTLTSAATASVMVSLSSSNTSVATVPASVTIAAGQTSATFAVSTNAVNSPVNVTISAASGGVTKPATLTVNPWLLSLALNPSTVIGALTNGTPATGTVTLGGPAPPGGAVVSLSSSNTSLVTLPSSVTVPAGSTTNTFSVTASNVTYTTSATLTATYNGSTQNTPLTINPWLQSFTLSPTSLVGGGGATVTGTLVLNAAAPTGGLPVTLTSANSAVTVPASVTVPAGSTTTTFTLPTAAVTTNTSGQITASYSNLNLSPFVTVLPMLSSLSLNPYSVTGGSPSTGTVTLNAAAPASGTMVTLSSSSASATVPASVTVPAGNTSAPFSITTSTVTSVTSAGISASYAGATAGPQTLTINPIQVSVSLSAGSVVGGTPLTGKVTLNGAAPPGGLVVTLSSSLSSATVPANVPVAAGSTTAFFAVTTTAVSSSAYGSITASYGGLSGSAPLTVLPLLQGVSLSPSSLTGGSSSTGTVTLNGPASSSGTAVTLTSSSLSATLSATSVTVLAGGTTATFTVSTASVASSTSATITASYAGASPTATLYIQPMLSYFYLSPSSVNGGTPSTGMLYLSNPAPPGGISVTLASDNTAAATVPATVPISSGSSSVQFPITTLNVAASATANISASYGPQKLSQALTVTPVPPLLSSVSLSSSWVVSGSTVSGTIYLSQAAPSGGITVTLASDTTATATVPANIFIAAGATSVPFTVTAANLTVSGTAIISASYGGVTCKASLLTVVPLVSSLSLSPANIVGGDPSTATVYFSLPAPSGVTLTLGSSNTGVATVPATVNVSSGSYSVTFPVSSVAVSTATTLMISASYGGVKQTATLSVNPMPTFTRVQAGPSEVTGGTGTYGTVTLSGIAPAAGIPVTLSSSNAAVTVPATVTVTSGQTSAGFSIGTTPVAATTTATLSASALGTTLTTPVTVDRPILTGFSFWPTTLIGGNGTTGTLNLSGPAPAGGVTLNVACVPANGAGFSPTVVVPFGFSTVQFPVATSTVNTPVTLVFTAANPLSSLETLAANVNLTLGTLHATDLLFPKAIQLQWNLSAVGNFLLYRNGVQIATLPNTATSYIDTFNWTSGQTYQYDISDGQTSPPTLLSTEQTIPYLVPALQDQAVDSRLDPRYATNVLLDHQFGSSVYKGGLFVGYDTDPSRIGRSFAQFNLGQSPSGAVYRTGRVNAYFLTGDMTGGVLNMTVGCQALPNNAWSAPTLTWDTAPITAAFNPAAPTQSVLIQYDPSTPGGVSAAGGSRQVTLSWIPPVTTKTIASYTVSYGINSGYYSSQVTGIVPSAMGTTSTTVTGLSNATTYYFAVQAVYSDGTTSNNSVPVSATPPNAGGTVTPPNLWYSWPLASDILNALQGGNGSLLSVGWASTNEAQPGWAYFAKTEYDPTLGPCVTHLWSVPTLISLQAPATVSLGGAASTTATGLLTVNAIGLQGTAVVQLTSSNPAVVSVPAQVTVTGLTRSFNMTVTAPASSTQVTITAKLGTIQRPVTMTINR